MKKSILALICCVLLSPASWAFSDVAITLGYFSTEVSPDSSTLQADSGTGFFTGFLGFMQMQEQFWMRAGAVFGQRKMDFTSNTTNLEYTLNTVEAPVTAMYMFNDMVGLFGGLRVGLIMDDQCSSSVANACTTINADFESLIYAGELGAHFRFTPNFGAEIAYDIGLTDFAADTKWDGGVVISGFMIF